MVDLSHSPPASPQGIHAGLSLTFSHTRPAHVPMTFADRFDDVLAAAQHGSEWAWQQLLGEVGPGVQAYARSQGVDDPEDLLGQVLEGMVRGIAKFRGNDAKFRSWVFTIAHSRIVDDRRRRSRRPLQGDREVPDVADTAGDAHDANAQLSVEVAMAMLDSLPDKQRDVVALRVIAGLSVDETASVLGRRPGSVRVAMHRAMQRLHDELSGEKNSNGVTQ